MTHSICNSCKHIINTDELRSMDKSVCPKCGNKEFRMEFISLVEFLPHNTTRIKQKDPHAKSKDKLRRDYFYGIDKNEEGKLMIKERLIDKDADIYYEFVKDSITGEIVRLEKPSSLKEHKGYGSAKKQDKP